MDSSTRVFNDLLQSLNFTQHVPPETPTHQSGSTLDCVIFRSDERLISNVSVDELVSDHNLIQFTASFSKPQKPTRTIVKRNWRQIEIPTLFCFMTFYWYIWYSIEIKKFMCEPIGPALGNSVTAEPVTHLDWFFNRPRGVIS